VAELAATDCTGPVLVSLLALLANEFSLAHPAMLGIIDINDITCQV